MPARPSATAATISAVPSMPILTAATAQIAKDRIHLPAHEGRLDAHGSPARRSVFWAVSAVTTEQP